MSVFRGSNVHFFFCLIIVFSFFFSEKGIAEELQAIKQSQLTLNLQKNRLFIEDCLSVGFEKKNAEARRKHISLNIDFNPILNEFGDSGIPDNHLFNSKTEAGERQYCLVDSEKKQDNIQKNNDYVFSLFTTKESKSIKNTLISGCFSSLEERKIPKIDFIIEDLQDSYSFMSNDGDVLSPYSYKKPCKSELKYTEFIYDHIKSTRSRKTKQIRNNILSNDETIDKLDDFESIDLDFKQSSKTKKTAMISAFEFKNYYYGDISYAQTITTSGVAGTSIQLRYEPLHIKFVENNLKKLDLISFVSGLTANIDFNIIKIKELDLTTIVVAGGINFKAILNITNKDKEVMLVLSPWINASFGACIYTTIDFISPCLKLDVGLEFGDNNLALTLGANQLLSYNASGISHIYPLGIKIGLVLPIGH